jgi:hypothetical protein
MLSSTALALRRREPLACSNNAASPRRHGPPSSSLATRAELHQHRRHTPDISTHRQLRLRWHTLISSVAATRHQAHNA